MSPVIRGVAAAFAAFTAEPIPAKSDAAEATKSGNATTYDIAAPPRSPIPQ
ncbi:hypothetical protein LAUMK191_04209 [Mycobacterium attenuatum]|uniref:Uncharacterized protein n=1 Tax=Mycobacterium attenuatum TaxID=2341086 RepID=A0A498Q9U0_9MYCO|nr:hypothetical protein LAUMK136_04208 [Mycobacterium attenuatum]VBA57831.1 hypothetical protein LAUMK191_04209 [Mycobacterium attenuatum]VBA60957.1 hypothetical protein LAUMK41_04328 [Mycobacterium attenuatum]